MPREDNRSRSYALPSYANTGKEDALRELLIRWQRGLVHVQLIQSRHMRAGQRLDYLDTRVFPRYLSQRQWKSVVNQVNAALRSWQELMVIAVRRWISRNIAEADRKTLHALNKAKQWWGHDILEPVVITFMRSSNSLPNLSRVRTLCLDGPIAQMENSQSSQFAQWVRISLGDGRKPIRIPLGENPYEADAPGKRARFLQLHIPERGPITYRVVRHSAVAGARVDGGILGLDWGLSNLVTTSDGRRFGGRLYQWLKQRDIELLALTKALQANGVKLNHSRRYRNLNRRIRSYVANEVGRIFNTLAREDLRMIVVEDLDFRYGGLSKKLNRILARAGRGCLKTKLASVTQDHGIAVVAVQAPHSSRECSGCGYVDPRNRISQGRFICRFCSKTLHADVNAARTILARRSSLSADRPMSRKDVLAHCDHQFETRWGIAVDRVRERPLRPNSRARQSVVLA